MNNNLYQIKLALQILKQGGTLLCPTDTVWGISADATNYEAVEKVFVLKNRPPEKSMIVLVSSIEMLQNYVEEIPKAALHMINEYQKPISIIYPKGKNLAENVMHTNGSIAIRIVQDDFCKPLIEKFGKAMISTSANVSGKATPTSFNEIEETVINGVDFCVDIPEKKKTIGQSSSLFLIEEGGVKQLR
ncbi:MAG: threonylcarbamoyl-AMP synthase [Chitinophagales bacterium]|nr:threonylcarbamoyl-AMP synthase [Chitinophagales bacterium]